MKKAQLLVSLIFALAFAQAAFSQETLAKNSPERKAIINALRVPVQRELKKPVIFDQVELKVKGDWAAIITATPRNPDGSRFDYRSSASSYAKCLNSNGEDCGDEQYQALLKKTGGKWKVVEFGSGATDLWIGSVCSETKGCPKELQF